MTTRDITVNPLPVDLAALLDRHGVEATVDGVLAAFEGKGKTVLVPPGKPCGRHVFYQVNVYADHTFERFGLGDNPLTALARAFAAMVGEEEG